MIAQAEFCPSQIGTIKFTIEWMLDELGPDVYKPGDVIIMNDPYRGSGHIPEHTLLKAVFHKGEIVGFVANCAHLAEPGAKAPGGLAGRCHRHLPGGAAPPAAVAAARGRATGGRLEDHLRQPPHAEGHLRRPHGDGRLAERGRAAPHQPHRHVRLRDGDHRHRRSDRHRRAAHGEEIRRIPDGEYRFSDIIEDDGVAERSYVVDCTVVVDGDAVTCDFTGSSGQAAGPMNGTYAVTASSVYNAFMHITDPTIPRNEAATGRSTSSPRRAPS